MNSLIVVICLIGTGYGAFISADEDTQQEEFKSIDSSVEDVDNHGRLLFLQIKRTTTTTSTSIKNLETFSMCLLKVDGAAGSKCKIEGRRRKRRSVIEDHTYAHMDHNQLEESVIMSSPKYAENTVTVDPAKAVGIESATEIRKGRFLLPSVSSTTTTVKTTSTSTKYTATVMMTAADCNKEFIVPLSFCNG